MFQNKVRVNQTIQRLRYSFAERIDRKTDISGFVFVLWEP